MATVSDQDTGAVETRPACSECGTPLLTSGKGRPARFCSAACRMKAHRRAAEQAKHVSRGTVPADSSRRGRNAGAEGESAEPKAGPSEDVSAGQRVSSQVPSWYHAKFASPAGQSPVDLQKRDETVIRETRRRDRYRLRALLRQISTVERCTRCGAECTGGAVAIVVNAGVAHLSGVETCGRIWLCPVCSAKIRVRRAEEIAEGVGRWIAQGGAAYFATATLPHDQGDALTASLGTLTKSWRSLTGTKYYSAEKERYGLVGNIKTVEITHGRHGWHPHIHAVLLTREQVGVYDLCEWFDALDRRWARALVRHGWAEGKRGYRFRLDIVTANTSSNLAAYVTKVQEGAGLGNEMARADLKHGRRSSRTPFQILADFGTHGLADDLDLWHEFETATAGKSALRWSRGLRKLLMPEAVEQTDEEIAAEEVGGDTVAYLLPNLWHRIAEIPGADVGVLAAIETGGYDGLIRLLTAYRLDVGSALTPDQWADAYVPDIGPQPPAN